MLTVISARGPSCQFTSDSRASITFSLNCCVKSRTGSGKVSASGGNGFGGGGGGRVSVDVFSRHDEPIFLVHGMVYQQTKSDTSFLLLRIHILV